MGERPGIGKSEKVSGEDIQPCFQTREKLYRAEGKEVSDQGN